MKKLIASLLLIVLVVPGLVWAEEAKETKHPRQQKDAPARKGMKLEQVTGQIVSLSVDTLTLAKAVSSKGEEAKGKHVEVQISQKPHLRGLLAQGLGRKAQLLCRKTDKGAWVLVKIESVDGVLWSARLRQRLSERAEERYRTMAKQLQENPQLREELRGLAQEDPEAFRQRIRQMHEQMPMAERPEIISARDGRGRRKPGPVSRDGARSRYARRGRGRPENPQIAKLEQQSQELAKQYGKAKGRNKEKLDDKLRNTLTEIFDLKAEAQTKQVKRLEKQLEKLHEKLEKREQNREAMIQKRFSQLTGQEDELSW